MPPKAATELPAPSKCSAPECDYATPTGLPNHDLVTQHLQIHAQVAHAAAQRPGTRATSSAAKVDKRPRPEAAQEMTEHAFRFFESEWGLYKRATGIAGQTLIDELWSCMSPELKKLAFDLGDIETLVTEELMMKRIKGLAVAVLHAAVHTVHLHEAKQLSDESIKTFAARVKGIASNCQLQKPCPCGKDVSYLEETVYHVVLSGIRDGELQEACTTQALLKNITDINSLVEFCTAKESGHLAANSTVGHIRSAYHAGKFQSQKTPQTPPPSNCGYCGARRHGDGSKKAREKDCKAFSATCTKCGRPSHFASVCRSRAKVAAVLEDNKDATNGAVEYGFYGIEQMPAQHTRYTPSSPTLTSNRFSVLATLTELPETPPAPTVATTHTQASPKPNSISPPAPRSARWTRRGTRKRSPRPQQPDSLPTDSHRIAESITLTMEQASLTAIVPLCHMEFSPGKGWQETPPMNSPILPVRLEVHQPTYVAMKLPLPYNRHHAAHHPLRTSGVADSGAQTNILPTAEAERMGISLPSLLPVRVRISGASSGSKINILGGVVLAVKGMSARSCTSLQLFYIADNVARIYLSLSTLRGLGVVPHNFPRVAEISEVGAAHTAQQGPQAQCSNSGVVLPGDSPCTCPHRTLSPPKAATLPCAATEQNLPQLKQFLLDRYASSAFNTCSQQPLPLIKGSPPLKLHVDPNAKPAAVHVAPQVPLHWQAPVLAGLARDCRLGVLERVPVNTPATWQSRMVVTAKHDGSPRRTIDFRNVNKHCPRQTHTTTSPWLQVASIPEDTVKSSFDAWHGYHSLELASEDRELTTFVTPWGRFRYKTCPQGILCAGDAYTDRMDRIFEDFPRSKRCIDDTLLWDNSIEEQFHRCCKFLDRCAENGVILNPTKFAFAQRELDFLGFRVTNTGVQPTKEFTDNILTFPSPANITDVRSWFGAVAQVSYSFASCPTMQPFRHLLSSKVPFSWSAELEASFKASKQEIVEQCRKGVRSFNPALPTCLATDWSRQGMGYWLCQQRCSCATTKPGCCPDGWQTVFIGSRFCHSAEQNYAPIEGEATAAAWAANKCRFFLLGLPSFLLALDHKPLLPILSDKELGTITNPRLLNQKVKLLPFRFLPIYIPGKLHVVPDTWSRRTDSPAPAQPRTKGHDLTDISNVTQGYSSSLAPPSWVSPPTSVAALLADSEPEPCLMAALRMDPSQEECCEVEDQETFLAEMAAVAVNDVTTTYILAAQSPVKMLTWERLQAAAAQSPIYQKLVTFLAAGPQDDIGSWPTDLHPYHPYRQNLLLMDQVVLYGERPLIPVSLREEVLQHLHSSHSGSSTMLARASQSVFWPNMKQEITATRAVCTSCTRAAPSNPYLPPAQPLQPDFPFSHCCMDFFHVDGKNYLALVDRYTGWLSISCLAKDDSKHVIAGLREYFARWGVAKHLTSDGASVFTSTECKDFFDRWGVTHRVSSAYYPRANKRSELAVKASKRLIMDNLGPKGELDTDRLARALLCHRNTPDPLTGLSPSMILFGRVLRDHLPAVHSKYQPRREWRMEADLREQAFAKRHAKMEERLAIGSKPLPTLCVGDTVVVQDQSNPLKPGRWTKTGTVVEQLTHDSYMVVIHGSRAPTQRNRKFLRRITPFHPMIPHPTLPTTLPAMPTRSTSALPHTPHRQSDTDDLTDIVTPNLDPSPASPVPPPHHPTAATPSVPATPPTPTVPSAPVQPPRAHGQLPGDRVQLPPPGHAQPTAATHRHVPLAPAGQDVITLLKQRERMGQVLSVQQD